MTFFWPAATNETKDRTLNMVQEVFAKRPRLSDADKPQTKSKYLVAKTTTNSSRVLGTRDIRMTGSQKKEVIASLSIHSDKRIFLEDPSSTGVDKLSSRVLLTGEGGDKDSWIVKSASAVVNRSTSRVVSGRVVVISRTGT